MKLIAAAFATAALTIAAPSMADVLKPCAACHDATAKKIGPTWKEVNAQNADVVAAVKNAIEKGSKGKYGKVPMGPQNAAKANADAIAKAVAALK
jgi:cytochrome c